MNSSNGLSRRERQILDILYRLDGGSVKEVQQALDDGSSDSTIRTLLGILVSKGELVKRESGLRYVYHPAVNRKKASQQALRRITTTFFDDSPMLAARSLLEGQSKISPREVEELEALLKRARRAKD